MMAMIVWSTVGGESLLKASTSQAHDLRTVSGEEGEMEDVLE